MRRGLLVVFVALCSFGQLTAQTDSTRHRLHLGLSFMTHGEHRGGGLPTTTGTVRDPKEGETVAEKKGEANFILGRTRLSLDFDMPHIDARAVIQNQAVWGSKTNSTLGLYEAWVRFRANNGLFAQLGRVPLSYDDERIIGPNDWAMASKAHDLARVGYEGHGHKVHVLLAYNQNAENLTKGSFYEGGAQPYKTMHTLWYHYDVPKIPIGASVLFMNIGMQGGTPDDNPRTEYQQLLGGYLTATPKNLKLEAAYYRQMGKNEYSIDIEAWMAAFKATMTFDQGRHTVAVGYDYLSGDDYVAVVQPGTIGLPNHDKIKGFSTVYGSHHEFYGVMDYFYQSAYIQGFTPGLQNAFAEFSFKPVRPLTCKVAYHYMAVATKLEGLNKTLGHDVELEASYRFSKNVSLSAGFSFMAGTETMYRLKQHSGDRSVQWGWFSLIVSPSLLTTKW